MAGYGCGDAAEEAPLGGNDAGSVGDGDSSVTPPGDSGVPGGGNDSAVGEYWMRSDVTVNLTQAVGANTAVIRSDITAYSLVKVESVNGQLQMKDWQCEVTTAQECEQYCTSASSEARDGETKAYAPSARALTVNADGSWSASKCAAAVGWQWDCAADAARALPTSDSDPAVYDPTGGGKGVNLTATVSAPNPLGLGNDVTASCTARLVQRVDLLYSGTLAGGKLATGVAKDDGSEQLALNPDPVTDSSSCGMPPAPVPVGAGTLRAIAAPSPIGDAWTCPTLEQFQAALPTK